MYKELPESVKRVVREYLLADDFRAAKQAHDNWVEQTHSANETLSPLQAHAE